MIYYLIKRTLLFCLMLSTLFPLTSIKGNVINSVNNESLIGANVFIEETSQGDATDIYGSYIIENIETCANCTYTLKVLYIGFEEKSYKIEAYDDKPITLNLSLSPTSLEAETTTVTAKKRQDKITDAPAAIELVSAKDIKREESTNLGSYLKGIKGVDFTRSSRSAATADFDRDGDLEIVVNNFNHEPYFLNLDPGMAFWYLPTSPDASFDSFWQP